MSGQGSARHGPAPEPLVRTGATFEEDWPGAEASATECVLNVYVLAATIERASQAWLRTQGLPSLAAFNVLTVLHGAGTDLQPSTISERLMVTRGTYVARRADEQDGRVRWVALTRAGRQAVDVLLPRVHQAERRLVAALEAPDRTRLLGAVARMQQAAAELEF
jgi:DNA-binding transcriptional ArsR family regulator